MTGRLNAQEIATYERDGLVIPDWRLSADRLARLRAALRALIAENPHIAPDFMLCPHLRDWDGQGLAIADDVWLETAREPAILNMVEQLIGPDIILWGSTVFGKPAGVGKETPLHQDGAYWPIRPLATCSVWIALDDSGPENGCLRYAPGSHRTRRLFAHRKEDRADLTLNMALEGDAGELRDVVLEAGQISLHDVYLAHGSAANRSGRPRAGYVLRYMPASSHFDFALGAQIDAEREGAHLAARRLHLMRGRDVSGANRLHG